MRADGELGCRVGFGKWAKGQVSAQARFSLLFSFSFIFSLFFSISSSNFKLIPGLSFQTLWQVYIQIIYSI
jgi:hypothetical protein